MQVQVSTDNSIRGTASMIDGIGDTLQESLSRFAEQITRIEVHLSDIDGPKSKGDDKNCLLEARIAGRQPIVVNHQAATLREAVDGATSKLEKSLDNLLSRIRNRKGRTSHSGE